jgi:hypothetical protein
MTEFTETAVRKMCRNHRCGCKLPEAVSNSRDAFCCRGCFTQFYRKHCLVCEAKMERKTGNQLVCGKRKCRNALQADISFGRYHASSTAKLMQKVPDSIDSKRSLKADGPWFIVAGPELGPTSFRFATLPLDDATADRVSRVNRAYWKEARRAVEERAVIKRHHPPVNILGRYKFPDAPVVDLRQPASPAAAPSSSGSLAILAAMRRAALSARDFHYSLFVSDRATPTADRRSWIRVSRQRAPIG